MNNIDACPFKTAEKEFEKISKETKIV